MLTVIVRPRKFFARGEVFQWEEEWNAAGKVHRECAAIDTITGPETRVDHRFVFLRCRECGASVRVSKVEFIQGFRKLLLDRKHLGVGEFLRFELEGRE